MKLFSRSPETASQAAGAPPASWAFDDLAALRASRRRAQIIAAAAAGVAALEAVALATLAPLKTVQPYTILVDRQTGYAETLRGVQTGTLSQDQALTQSFAMQYVMARETVDMSDLVDRYRKVTLWSSGEARAQYKRSLERSNPESPLKVYPASTVVSTIVKSVTPLSPTSAIVRFDTVRRDAGASSGERRAWSAVLTYRYSGAPMRMADRAFNPLGFQVLTYRRDAEATTAGAVRFDSAGNPVS
ncbi:type IV secretion system protein [Caulobacter sp. SSI4214]|jgi:type IV secretion system protein VirB8|uniref:virB8 family protein n=1 Tax=Caulobacter sp. SSI4214 TaxID=2575739 RepID=UPI0014391ABE|nr:type IV secretion system protein [Caulobacter sp. SSI4214]